MQEEKISKFNTNNMELSEVSIAKVAALLSLPKGKVEPFSMRNIKSLYYNKIMTERIYANPALDLNFQK